MHLRRVAASALALTLVIGAGASLPGFASPAAAAEGANIVCDSGSVEYGETLNCVAHFTTDGYTALVGYGNMSASNGSESATVIGASCETGWVNFDATCAFSVVADIAGPTMTINASWTGFFLPDRSGSLVVDITRAPFDVGVADATRAFGEPNPEFEMLYYGFKLDDDASIMGTPSFSTEADETSLPGTYLVWPDQGVTPMGGYYQLNGGFPGTLTITAPDAPLVVDLPESVVFDEGNFVADTTDQYGRQISFSASGACEYNGGGAIDFLYVGTCSLEMTAEGGSTGYNDATASATIEVLPFPVQVAWFYQEPIRLGDATPDTIWNAEVSSYFHGTWSYDVPELVVGYNTITATFTPDADMTNYTSGSATFELLVLPTNLTVGTSSDVTAVAGVPYVLEATFPDCNMQCQFHWFVDGVQQGYDFVQLDYTGGDGYFDAVSQFSFAYSEGQHIVRLEAVDVNGDVLSSEITVTVAPAPAVAPPAGDADAAAAKVAADAAAAKAAAQAAAAQHHANASVPDTALAASLPSGSSVPLGLFGLVALLAAGVIVLKDRRRIR